jgi:hypothetical protein
VVSPSFWLDVLKEPNENNIGQAANTLSSSSPFSVFELNDDENEVKLVAVAFSLTRKRAQHFYYVYLARPMIELVGGRLTEEKGDLPIERANVLHRNVHLPQGQASRLVREWIRHSSELDVHRKAKNQLKVWATELRSEIPPDFHSHWLFE